MTARYVFKASSIYLCVTAAEVAGAFISLPIMTRALAPSDYGLLLLIANTVALTNLVFGYSLAQALPTLFVAASTQQQRRDVTTTILLAIAAMSAVIYVALVLLAETLAPRMLGVAIPRDVAMVAAVAAFLVSFALCLAYVVRLQELHKLFGAVQLPAVAIQLSVLVTLLLVWRWGLLSPYAAMLAAGLFTATIYAVSMRYWLTGRFDPAVLKAAVGIGASMLPWQIATLLTTNAAGFFLARDGRMSEAGVYAVAASVVSVLINLSNSFSNVWTPFVLLRHADPATAATQRRVFEIFSSGLLVVAAVLSLIAEHAVTLLLGKPFHQAFHYVPPLAFTYCLYCFANNFAQGLQAKQRTGAYAWIGFTVAVLFIAAALPLVHRFGPHGLIAAMAVAFLTMLVLLQAVSERLLPVAYPWARHGLMWGGAVCIVAAVYAGGAGWQALLVKALAGLVVLSLPFAFKAIRFADIRNALAAPSALRP